MITGTGISLTAPVLSASVPVYAASVTPASSFEYETKSDGTIMITGFTGTETDIVIPDTIEGKKVITIRNYAFEYCTNLSNIILPDGITEIGSGAFSNCTNLKSITIPKSVKQIGESAFRNCTSLKNITIPDSVAKIERDAFEGTAWYDNKPDGNIYIGNLYYKYKGTLPHDANITIKYGTTAICPEAFYGCSDLTSISIPNTVKEIGGAAFSDCTGLTSITIPDSVTIIGNSSFAGCTNLNNIQICRNTIHIGINAFFDTAWFNNQPKGDVYIGDFYYYYNDFINDDTKIVIKEGTKRIADGAFGYRLVSDITLPDSLVSLGDKTFFSCLRLKSLNIPEGVTEIGENTFTDCDKLTIYGKKGSYADAYAKAQNIPFIAISAPLKNEASVSAKKVYLGGKVTVDLKSSEGTAPYKYSVFYKKSTGSKWSLLTANTTKAAVDFTPKAAAAYYIKVIAKDSKGNSASKLFIVTAKKPLTNISKLGTSTAKAGQTVKVRCYAQGGTGGYQYTVYYKKSISNKWTKLRGYKSTNLVLYTPKAGSKYDITNHRCPPPLRRRVPFGLSVGVIIPH